MFIRVKYDDNRYDMVHQDLLDLLIEQGKIREFKRSDGWVVVGVNRLRRRSNAGYQGQERRKGPEPVNF